MKPNSFNEKIYLEECEGKEKKFFRVKKIENVFLEKFLYNFSKLFWPEFLCIHES